MTTFDELEFLSKYVIIYINESVYTSALLIYIFKACIFVISVKISSDVSALFYYFVASVYLFCNLRLYLLIKH